MQKIKLFMWILLGNSCLLLTGCAGNPPQWWNPSGAYHASTAAPAASAGEQPGHAVSTEEEIPQDTFDPGLEEYEELKLTPLATEPEETQAETQTQATALENALPLTDPSVLE